MTLRSLCLRLSLASACLVSVHAQTTAEPTLRLADLVVTPSRFGVGDTPALTTATLTHEELAVLPQIGEDLYRTIARLPGVAADDFSAKFWIRGAANNRLLARLDGATLIEPFHLKDVDGALAIIDLSSVSRIDLRTGGFGAEFGNRSAGVLAMETEIPAGRPRAASLGVSLSGVRAAYTDTFADGKGHARLTARRGYPDLALRVEGRQDELFPVYYDASLRVDYALTPRDTLSFHVLHAGDTLKVVEPGDPDLNSNYDSTYAWLRWQGAPREGLSGEAVVTLSRLGWHRRGDGLFGDRLALSLRDDRRLDNVALRNEWSLDLGSRAVLRGGIEADNGDMRYDYVLSREENVVTNGVLTVVPRTANVHLRPSGGRFGLFAATRYQLSDQIVIEPGLRFDHQSATDDDHWSPRFAASWQAGPHTTVRAAWGAYFQSQGLHELGVPDNDLKFHRAELAEHRVLSLEQRLAPGLNFRAELYERRTTRVRPRWDNTVYIYNIFPEVESDRTLIAPRLSRARGIEFLLERRARQGLGWTASYALSESRDELAGRSLPTPRDQRHTVHLDANYRLNERWTFSASWQYHSGWPTTDVSYVLVPLNNGRRFVQRVVGPAYATHLPDYHRLDLRATRTWRLPHSVLTAFIDVFNAYDHTNLVGYRYSALVSGNTVTAVREVRDMLPLIPSAGLTWDF